MKKFFLDESGIFSLIRLMSLLSFFVATFYTIFALFTGSTIFDWNVLSLWIAAAFVPKTIQKIAEKETVIVSDQKNSLSEFVQDDAKDFSMIRILSLGAFIISASYTIMGIVTATKIEVNGLIVWLLAAFAPKVFQKYVENIADKFFKKDEPKSI